MLWRVLIVSALCAVTINAAPPVLCNGKSYPTCQSLDSAVQCSAVEFCATAVWKDELLPPDNTGLCRACQHVVDYIRTYTDRTTDQITNGVSYMCNQLVGRDISQRCASSFRKQSQELELLIQSRVAGIKVCTLAGLCHNYRQSGFPGFPGAEHEDVMDLTSSIDTEIVLLPTARHNGSAQRRRRQTERIPTKCNKGAKFWCLSAENARLCGKTKYCKRKVWPKNCKPRDGDMKKC